jgi:hypothetical protein
MVARATMLRILRDMVRRIGVTIGYATPARTLGRRSNDSLFLRVPRLDAGRAARLFDLGLSPGGASSCRGAKYA